MSIFFLQACLNERLITCPNHFNRLSVTLLDIFATPPDPRMFLVVTLSVHVQS